MPLVVLTHTCNHPQALGGKGDLIDVSDDMAKYLFDRRGAKPHKTKAVPASVPPTVEPDDAKPEEEGKPESAREARRRKRAKDKPSEAAPTDPPADDAGDGDETGSSNEDDASA